MGNLINYTDLVARSLARAGVDSAIYNLDGATGVNDIVATAPPNFIVLKNMMAFIFESNAINTLPMTLKIGALPAKAMVIEGQAIVAGQIHGADLPVLCFYDANADWFNVVVSLSPSTSATLAQIYAGAIGASLFYARADHQHPSVSQGTITNDNAGAGIIGEYVEVVVPSGSAVTLANNVPESIAGLALSAGDWELSANVIALFNATSGRLYSQIGISGTVNTLPADQDTSQFIMAPLAVYSGVPIVAVPPTRFSLAVPSTLYLSVISAWQAPVTTASAYGKMRARRIR
jgi:hypothetical protein